MATVSDERLQELLEATQHHAEARRDAHMPEFIVALDVDRAAALRELQSLRARSLPDTDNQPYA